MTAAERIDRGYLGTLLRLTLLALGLLEAILDGRQPADLGLPRLLGVVPADCRGGGRPCWAPVLSVEICTSSRHPVTAATCPYSEVAGGPRLARRQSGGPAPFRVLARTRHVA